MGRTTIFFLAAILIGLEACTGLVLKKDDSDGETAGKVAVRTVMGVYTLGISELFMTTRRREWEFHEVVIHYVGLKRDDVVSDWGPPAATAALDNGGEVIEYHQYGPIVMSTYGNRYGATAVASQSTCTVRYTVDANHVVVRALHIGC